MGALNVKRAREKEEVPKVAAKEERKALESRSSGHQPGEAVARKWNQVLGGW